MNHTEERPVAKPFSEACERNKEPIAEQLVRLFADCRQILEIGSGTGQHAAYFALKLPHLTWQPSDLPLHHAGIEAWIKGSKQNNILPPLHLDVSRFPWPELSADGLFTANTLHIMPWESVQDLFKGASELLPPKALLVAYGPFNENGAYTAPSNKSFDEFIRHRDPRSGLRDRQALNALAESCGFKPLERHEMPANNQLLVWQKQVPGLLQRLRNKLGSSR
jgi:hypothetical protein